MNTALVGKADLLPIHDPAQVGCGVEQKVCNGGVHGQNMPEDPCVCNVVSYALPPPNRPPKLLLMTLVSTLWIWLPLGWSSWIWP